MGSNEPSKDKPSASQTLESSPSAERKHMPLPSSGWNVSGKALRHRAHNIKAYMKMSHDSKLSNKKSQSSARDKGEGDRDEPEDVTPKEKGSEKDAKSEEGKPKGPSGQNESKVGSPLGFNVSKQIHSIKRRMYHMVTAKPSASFSEKSTDTLSQTLFNEKVYLECRYIGATNEKVYIYEGLQLIWETLYIALKQNPFADALLGVSGGESPRKIFQALADFCELLEQQDKAAPPQEGAAEIETPSKTAQCRNLPWNRIKLFLVDERYVLPTDPDSNQKMVRDILLANGSVHIPEENLIFPNTQLPLEECVADYNSRLKLALSRSGRPACITLGFGPDGHVASWFPPMSEHDYKVSHSDEPVVHHTTQERGFPAKDRITVSMSVIESAKAKVFFITGKEKVGLWKEKVLGSEEFISSPACQIVRSGNAIVVSHPPVLDDECQNVCRLHQQSHLSLIIFGASGDLARKKTIPALFSLYCEGHLPDNFHIIGYGRTAMTTEQFIKKIEPHLLSLSQYYQDVRESELSRMQRTVVGFLAGFKEKLVFVSGDYASDEDMINLANVTDRLERETRVLHSHRLFYLALPPTVFLTAARHAQTYCQSSNGWNRIVLEKPFGSDSESSEILSEALLRVFCEEQIYRIDHYLGKEMMLNMMAFRFANGAFSPLLSWHHIAAVRITFKEKIGVEGRGGYFDQFGIIRDIMQNHLLQIMSVIAMERPASLRDDDIRDEKVKLLKQVQPAKLELTVLGQYTESADESIPGYLDDPSVNPKSLTPTFCVTVLHVNNERWSRVPFILKAGKALEDRRIEIRLQFRSVPGNLFGENIPRNEIVVQIQPTEAIYIKLMTKQPGLNYSLAQTELDFSLAHRFRNARLPEAYERLILDVIRGDKKNFVRSDELREAWRIFTPLLKTIEENKVKPLHYPAKSSGPAEAYELIQKHDFKYNEGYSYTKQLISG